MDWMTKELEFDSPQGQESFLFFIESRPALVSTQPPVLLPFVEGGPFPRDWKGQSAQVKLYLNYPVPLHGMMRN
jgi:hypothetical protein